MNEEYARGLAAMAQQQADSQGQPPVEPWEPHTPAEHIVSVVGNAWFGIVDAIVRKQIEENTFARGDRERTPLTPKDLYMSIPWEEIDGQLLMHFFSPRPDATEMQARWYLIEKLYRTTLGVNLSQEELLNSYLQTQHMGQLMWSELANTPLSVPGFERVKKADWGEPNIDGSINPGILRSTEWEEGCPWITYPLERPTGMSEREPFTSPSLLLMGKPDVQLEFARSVITGAHIADTQARQYHSNPRIHVSVFAPFDEQKELARTFGNLKIFGDPIMSMSTRPDIGPVQAWQHIGRLEMLLDHIQSRSLHPFRVTDKRPHHVVVILGLDRLLQEAQIGVDAFNGRINDNMFRNAISLDGVLSALIASRDPRVHILATSGFDPGQDPIVHHVFANLNRRFAERLYGETRGESIRFVPNNLRLETNALPPHQVATLTRNGVATYWIPRA